ncbi:MAG: ribosome biogenesis GTP-binding protein YihA/YsxC [Candidatus Hinthialibacter antarcticus]|nr:ribosome biogenesis GTP-binding protein YihA/YsxC [Candidatus Hinthialibacter antarcticus]
MSYRIVEASFVTTAPTMKFCPPADRVEIAVAGRSNVGKSSLINALCNHKSLAKTSGTPGKTRAINYFSLRIEPGSMKFYLVDLPGYGYAKVSKSEQGEWGKSMADFLHRREPLVSVIHLIDCRHDPSKQDVQMRDWILTTGLVPITVFTKADKLKRGALNQQIKRMEKLLLFGENERWITTSAVKKDGLKELSVMIGELVESVPEGRISNPDEE